MKWTQVIDPLHSIYLSALVAVIPIAFIFWALIIKKMKGYKASLLTTLIALVVAIAVYKMPVQLAVLSTLHGAVYGLFPICWIIVSAVYLFNLTVESGQFEVIKHFMASITGDRRMQALLIAFSFGSFLEGTAGFGAPVAITAAMLVGLGFDPLYAAGICLVANTAPVAFGAIGIPVSVASQVSGIPEMAISQMVGRTLPFLSLLVPVYLVIMMAGVRKTMSVLPAIMVSGGSFALFQWSVSNFLGPALPDVIAGLGSIVCLVIYLRIRKIKTVWRFRNEPPPTIQLGVSYTTGQIIRACSPFILLTIMIISWGLKPLKHMLDSVGLVTFEIPGLHNMISDASGKQLPHLFTFNFLSAAGTAIFISALISIPLLGVGPRKAVAIFAATLKQIRYPIITVSAILGFAYLVNDSGITITMAEALAGTGVLFPFFAPVLGWLGVFITGSDTSANALFGKLQAATATSIGVDPVVTVAANVSGGVVGKMISPTSIAVAAAAGGLVGRESDLFRFTFKHSFIMLSLICVLVLLQAYIVKWTIPVYHVVEKKAPLVVGDHSDGLFYLLMLAAVLIALSVYVLTRGGKKNLKPGYE